MEAEIEEPRGVGQLPGQPQILAKDRLQIPRRSRFWRSSLEMECFYCFVDDRLVENEGDVEFHHIKPFSEDGPTEMAKIGAVCKERHRRIRTLSLSEFRDQLAMDRFFSHPDRRGLDDLLGFKLSANGVWATINQNHLFQVLTNLAMEPPVRTDSEAIRDETGNVGGSVGVRCPARLDDDLADHRRVRPAGIRINSRLVELDDIGAPGHQRSRVKGAIYGDSAMLNPVDVHPSHAVSHLDHDGWGLEARSAFEGHLNLVNLCALIGFRTGEESQQPEKERYRCYK